MSPNETQDQAPAGFAPLGLLPELVATLTELGYEEPTPIQREAIPPLLAGRDLLGQAATGTGKTAAFALPMLQRLEPGRPRPSHPRALVLVPTRELAMQVAEAIHKYGKARRITVLPIYGGQSIGQQLRALDRGVDIVVATPGRAVDHITRGTLVLDSVEMLVLDEADEMLDMGFAEDMDAILEQTPKGKQTALFSATLPARIAGIAERGMTDPVRLAIASERMKSGEVPRVRQMAYVVPRVHKPMALARVLDVENPTSTIVFCRTRVEVEELTEAMNGHGFQAEALHGGYSQDQRDRVMKRFRAGKADLLIATDVAARGLDIEHLSHVVNYDLPNEPGAYVHRIGRTGRAGREGVAITFVEPREHRYLRSIEQLTRQRITIATIPTVADLRNRRLELTRATLREAVVAGELDRFRAIVQELSTEFDPMDVAAAAVKLAHAAGGGDAEKSGEEEDVLVAPTSRPDSMRPGSTRPDLRRDAPRESWQSEKGGKGPRARRGPAWDSVRLYIGAGRADLVRPGDVVGAIANEAGVGGGAIGAIEIADRFSTVEVPSDRAEEIIRALRKTTIRGRKVVVRVFEER